MRLRGAFNIFLALVLVAIGVYFVVGGSSFTTPSNNVTYINGNYTISASTDAVVNVWNVTFYYVTNASGVLRYNLSNMLANVTNTTVGSATVGSFIFYSANFSDGNYTISALFMNKSNTGNLTINTTIYVDNKPPYSLTLIYPVNQTFINNASIQFGFNVSDSMSGNHTWGNPINCTFSVNGSMISSIYVNSSLIVGNANSSNILGANLGRGTNWFNVSSTSFDAGYHVWNVSCVDYNNNVNSSLSIPYNNWFKYRFGGNFTLTDTVGPTTTTPTFSASSVTEGGSVTATCTGTDVISSDPTEYVSIKGPLNSDWQGDIGTSPYTFTGTTDIGTYTTRCRSRDTTGNFGSYSSEATFAVTKSPGPSQTSSGPGGPSGVGPTVSVNVFAGQTRDLGDIDNGQGIINAYQTSVVTFSVGTSSGVADQHSIKFDEVDYIGGEITVTLSSDPVILTMKVGEIKSVDVDSDGTEDLEVTLNSIDENGRVNMNIKDLVITTAEEEETTGETQPTEVTGGMSWIWWVLIVVVIVVIIALILPRKK